MKPKHKSTVRIPSSKSDDQPATRKMLKLVRTELRSDIASLKHEFISYREETRSTLARMELKFEQQTADNRIVLEGLQTLWQRQDEHSKDRSAHRA